MVPTHIVYDGSNAYIVPHMMVTLMQLSWLRVTEMITQKAAIAIDHAPR